MNAHAVKCPTCSSRNGTRCRDFDGSPLNGTHVGRARIARATEAGKMLRYRKLHGRYQVLQFPRVEVGTVWRTADGWTAATPDGEVVTRNWRGARSTAAGLLLEPIVGKVTS